MWRQRSLLLCRGAETHHGNVDRIGQEILAAFRELGWSVADAVIDGADPRATLDPLRERIEAGEFDLQLSVQDMGHFAGSLIGELFARGGVRRLYWSLDHPYSSWRAVADLPPGAVVTYPTASNLDCCRRHLRADIDLHCVAHAAIPQEGHPWEGRDIEILFVGNMPRPLPAEMRAGWRAEHGETWASLLEAMAERFDPAGTPSLDGLADEVLAARGLSPGLQDRFELMRVFDLYAWAEARLAYARALSELPVTFVGAGWEGIAGGAGRTLGPMESGQARALMARSRIVLNLLPAYYRSHERVFEGMAAGAVVASTGGGYLANARRLESDAADGSAILNLGPPGEAPMRLGALLGDETALRRMAEAGWQEQRAHHSWRHRVAELLKAVEEADSKKVAERPAAIATTEGRGSWRNRSIMLFRSNISAENNLERLGAGVLAGFAQCGWTVHDVDLSQGDGQARMMAATGLLMGGRVDLLLTILGMGDVKGGEAELARAGVRRLCWDVNHPYSLWDATAALPPGSLVCFTTASNLDCVRRFIRADLHLDLFAHAAPVAEPLPWSRRAIPALFIGNLERPLPDEMRAGWAAQHGARWGGVLNEMAERFDPAATPTLEGLAEQALAARGIGSAERRDFFTLLRIFDGYARARTRLDYARALRGHAVTYVGRGWEEVAGEAARTLGPLPAARTRELMREARVVLNILPAYYRSHERVFEGMACGAAVLSGGNGYIANALGKATDEADDVAIAYVGAAAQAGDRLAALLSNHEGLRAVADAGLAEQRARHTWAHRVAALLASLKASGERRAPAVAAGS